jgi:uncharacterized membrane protein
MICGLEIGMLIGGIIALVLGKIRLTKMVVVEGALARVAGLVMVLPIPLAFAANVCLAGTNAGNNSAEYATKAQIMEAAIAIGCLFVTVVIIMVGASSQKKQREQEEQSSDYSAGPDERPPYPPETR